MSDVSGAAIPPEWREHVVPRRGRAASIDRSWAAVEESLALWRDHEETYVVWERGTRGPEHEAWAFTRALAAAREGEPLTGVTVRGAGAALGIRRWAGRKGLRWTDPARQLRGVESTVLADALVVAGGLPFAAAAMLELTAWRHGDSQGSSSTPIDFVPDDDSVGSLGQYTHCLRRIREHVVAADDAEYQQMVARLEECRGDHLWRRLLTVFLAPTRSDWAARDFAELATRNPGPEGRYRAWSKPFPSTGHTFAGLDLRRAESDLLFGAAGTPDQVRIALEFGWADVPARGFDYVLANAVEALGLDAAANTVGDWLADRKPSKAQQSAARLIARVPGDEALRQVTRWLDLPTVLADAELLARRDPARMARALSAAPSTTGRTPGERGKAAAAAARLAEVCQVVTTNATTNPATNATTDPAGAPAGAPEWAYPEALPSVLVAGGTSALPTEAIVRLVALLAVNGGRDDLTTAAYDPASLAEFGRALCDRWRASGAPIEHRWALDVQASIGDDATAAYLGQLVGEWTRADGDEVLRGAVDALVRMDTDAARQGLHRLLRRRTSRSDQVREALDKRLAELAADRGWPLTQVNDWLVPRLGLESGGRMELSGRFSVGFDDALQPFVRNAAGQALAALPKGAPGDARQRFTLLKREMRALLPERLSRLERAMVDRERWRGTAFRELLVDHPVMWHLVRRPLWAEFDADDAVLRTFRIAEDSSLADVHDSTSTLAPDARVGIPHPSLLDTATIEAWRPIFADYRIIPLFPQLERPVHRFVEDERTAMGLARFVSLPVRAENVPILRERGWTHEWGGKFLWRAGGRPNTELNLIPGPARDKTWPDQTVEAVWRVHAEAWSRLDPVHVSELLRDLTDLTDPAG